MEAEEEEEDDATLRAALVSCDTLRSVSSVRASKKEAHRGAKPS